ncbi:MAG: prephenate dehydratase [Cryomorphaceae bacterium]|jgi:prephenate dehydratase|nr:prephenate dehydratase [Cryomorphaceae bacterium]MDG1888979.1 prephenate dehydratase [Flavobacteriaceae bacterium]MBT3503255.1 prephenate dehydratase [Cryomorphaceae bacterium]MBT3689375.1 prephenate dehydratase [Cryomorphaceae bacterium]MBT4222657.1 prephenate dehydratase [Cryomorphaceae bacterium]
MKVSIQGIKGSFHHMVANHYFDSFELNECLTFESLVKSVVNNESEYGIMAIENSIAGSILPNYALIDEYNLSIIGEYSLSIDHNLMCLPNQNITEIKEVHSHPMALLQCSKFFSNYPHIKLIETEDTALYAKNIRDNKISGVGAIASLDASKIYTLQILESSIQTIKNNKTRFVILEKNKNNKMDYDKAALKFILDHKRGSLATVLNMMSDCSLNLTKIQSLPVIQTPGKYAFFVDITFKSIENYQKAVKIIELMAQEFKILGEYKYQKS